MLYSKKGKRSIDGIVSTISSTPKKRYTFHSFYTSKKIFFFSFLFLTLSFLGGIIFFASEGVKGATYAWIQSSWSGGASTDTAVHPTSQNDWNTYESAVGVTAGDSISLLRESN
jgi:hypothetical protein